MKFAEKCAAVKLLLSDVDGVLTDGRVIYDNNGIESKQFHIRDGQGIRLWQESGGLFGVVTARSSQIVKLRTEELRIAIVRQGIDNKLETVRELAEEQRMELSQIAYVGDDLLDLATIQSVGLGIAVADAAEEVRQAADYTAKLPGGCGAIREVVEMLLKKTGRWEAGLRRYRL